MTETTLLQFEGLNAPVALTDAAEVEAMLSDVLSAWPHNRIASSAAVPPFATITRSGCDKWVLVAQDAPFEPREWDTVNTVCDLVAEMAWERLRTDPELLCLHAAAVEFEGRLVLFPSGRRAGKSTLAVALSYLGHRLFSDDFVPVEIDPADRTMRGLANGIAPRLRLPLPDDTSAAFRAWVADDPGPQNRQYTYLAGAELAGANAQAPLGAVVVLDRQDGVDAPRLEPIAPEEALSRLIFQNFARQVHAGRILRSLQSVVAGLPTYRLVYSGFEAAAAHLHTAPELQALAPATLVEEMPEGRFAVLPVDLAPEDLQFDPNAAYIQRPGLTETGAGKDSFLADRDGTAIHRLNRGSALIWRLLEERMRLHDLAAVISEVFPAVDPAQIHTDTERTLRALLAARLIMPAER